MSAFTIESLKEIENNSLLPENIRDLAKLRLDAIRVVLHSKEIHTDPKNNFLFDIAIENLLQTPLGWETEQ